MRIRSISPLSNRPLGSILLSVAAAAVLTGIFKGTGMVDAVATWVAHVIPTSMGSHLAIITGLLSIPFTFLMSNDAFYFGVLPVLSETAGNYGISAAEMARASITGQPFHMQSPLVPAILLLVSLAGVSLADHHKKVLWRAAVVAIVMLVTGTVIGALILGVMASGFTFVGVDAYIQDIIKGLIIVVAVVIDQYRNKRKLKR